MLQHFLNETNTCVRPTLKLVPLFEGKLCTHTSVEPVYLGQLPLFKGKLCTHTSVEPVSLGQLTNITLTAKLCTQTHIEPLTPHYQ